MVQARSGGRLISRWWILGGLVGVAAFFVLWTIFQVVWTAHRYEVPASADAIVVLGAAQWNGDPSPVFEGRLLRALDLYETGIAEYIVTTGSSQPGDQVTQGFAGFEYLRNQGVPEESILIVIDGTNTWEELTATAGVLADRDLESAILVSDPYHNYRLLRMGAAVGLDVSVASTDLDPTLANYARESVATIAGLLLGWRRVSNLR